MKLGSRPPAVPVKIPQSVLLAVCVGSLASCSAPAKEHPPGSAPSGSRTIAPPRLEIAPAPAPNQPLFGSDESGPSLTPGPDVVTAESATPSSSSAYPGCGQAIPSAKLWDETTESEVLDAISAAKACAAENHRRLLLEFVAPWCDDCREMAKLDETSVVATTLKARFERVRVNVGKWDRHEGLRRTFDVRALATYIVIDPKTSKQLAKTTLEPISKKGQRLSADDWARWLSRH